VRRRLALQARAAAHLAPRPLVRAADRRAAAAAASAAALAAAEARKRSAGCVAVLGRDAAQNALGKRVGRGGAVAEDARRGRGR